LAAAHLLIRGRVHRAVPQTLGQLLDRGFGVRGRFRRGYARRGGRGGFGRMAFERFAVMTGRAELII
jgi:hypothetical protein